MPEDEENLKVSRSKTLCDNDKPKVIDVDDLGSGVDPTDVDLGEINL